MLHFSFRPRGRTEEEKSAENGQQLPPDSETQVDSSITMAARITKLALVSAMAVALTSLRPTSALVVVARSLGAGHSAEAREELQDTAQPARSKVAGRESTSRNSQPADTVRKYLENENNKDQIGRLRPRHPDSASQQRDAKRRPPGADLASTKYATATKDKAGWNHVR